MATLILDSDEEDVVIIAERFLPPAKASKAKRKRRKEKRKERKRLKKKEHSERQTQASQTRATARSTPKAASQEVHIVPAVASRKKRPAAVDCCYRVRSAGDYPATLCAECRRPLDSLGPDVAVVEVERPWLQEACLVHAQMPCLTAAGLLRAPMQPPRPEEKKKLHNMVLELKGNIRVFVRVRPMGDKEKAAETAGEVTITFAEEGKVSVYDTNQQRRKWFDFDKAFQPNSTQQEVFEEVKPLATSVLDGYNVCIFAYGQTGSGKTFTMTGSDANPGLNTRVLRELFQIRDHRKEEVEISISLSVSEIYNEMIKDLFNPDSAKTKKLDVKQNSDGTNSVPGLTERQVNSVEEVLKYMKEAQSNRTVMATDMNDESSRSHSIVQVKTTNVNRKDKTQYLGKINLIDLAGSENVNKSGVQGQGMREAQNINKSLLALGDVVASLQSKSGHVSYRNSKLTMMLKDSLGGDSKTMMIVQCSPAQSNVTETTSSLTFASKARNVELGKATRNVKAGEAG